MEPGGLRRPASSSIGLPSTPFNFVDYDELCRTPSNFVGFRRTPLKIQLGILVSSDLSWSPHIRAIAGKARQKASWVLSVFHTRSPDIMARMPSE